MYNNQEHEGRWCAASNVIRSGRVVQALPLRLFLKGQFIKALALVRPNTVEFALLDGSTVTDWFEIPTFSNVLAATVIPTQHERSDLLCLLTDNLQYFIVRVTTNRAIEVEVKQKLERVASTTDEKYFMGCDYCFNVRDTEGYVFFAVGSTITMVSFSEKRDGLRLVQTSTNRLQLDEIIHIGPISQLHSKYKQQTLGVIVENEGKTSFRMVNGAPLRLLDNPNINKHNLLHFFSGRELVLLTGREIFLYNYQSTKPIMTHRLPLVQCGNQILFLEEVYCMVGESLLMFNHQGVKDYGQIDGQYAYHLGDNRLVVWHTDQDTRMLELDDHEYREKYRWLNLSQIYSVECLDDCGLQTYVVVSPNRTSQLTLLRKALKTEPLGNIELDDPVACMYRVSQHPEEYVLLGLTDETTLLLSLTPTGLEQLWRIDMKLVLASDSYVVFSNGIYRMDYPQRKMELLLEVKIERAAKCQLNLAYSTANELIVYSLQNRKIVERIELVAPLAALCYSDGILGYAEWNSKQVNVRKDKIGDILHLSYQPRSIELLGNYLMVGSAGGHLQIYNFKGSPVLEQQFCCGSLPTKLVRLDQTVYCMSSSVITVSIADSSIRKSTIALRNVSNLQLGLTPDILIVSCFGELTSYRVCTTEQLNSQSLKVCNSNIQVPHVRLFGKVVHVFKCKQLILVDPYKYQQKSIPHEFQTISCVEICEKGLLVAGTINNAKYLSYFRQGKELIRQVAKRLPTILRWLPSGKVTIGYDNDLKIIQLDEQNIKITDLASIEITVRCSSLAASQQLNKLLVADPFKSLLLLDCQFNKMPIKTTTVAAINCSRLCNDVAFLDELIIACDKKGGVLAMLPWLDAPNDLQKMGLYIVGSSNLNEQVWTLTSEHRQSLLFGTAQGSVGRLRIMDKQSYETLKKVEQLAKQTLPFLTEDYFNNKPKVQALASQVNTRQQNCMIDCQPLIAFLALSQSRSLLAQSQLSYEHVASMVEALSHPPTTRVP